MGEEISQNSILQLSCFEKVMLLFAFAVLFQNYPLVILTCVKSNKIYLPATSTRVSQPFAVSSKDGPASGSSDVTINMPIPVSIKFAIAF